MSRMDTGRLPLFLTFKGFIPDSSEESLSVLTVSKIQISRMATVEDGNVAGSDVVVIRKHHNGQSGEYALVVDNWPEEAAAMNKSSRVAEFFSPIEIKGFACRGKRDGIHVQFHSRKDLGWALQEKQWKYVDDRCIRLSEKDDHGALNNRATWESIHWVLRLDILSYFDAFQRSRLRSVGKQWNTTLKSSWDQDVNRCLFFDLKHAQKRSAVQLVMEKVERYITQNCSASRDEIPRLVLKFDKGDKVPVFLDEILLSQECEQCAGSLWSLEQFLRENLFPEAMLIGVSVWLTDELQQFFGECCCSIAKTTKMIFHECVFAVMHHFAALVEGGTAFSEDRVKMHRCQIDVQDFSISLDQHLTGKENHMQFYREMDKQGLFWRFPAEQVDWLRSVLDEVPEDDPQDVIEMNESHEYSLRQVIVKYLKEDEIRQTAQDWEPTGVYFEGLQLSWRECYFLGWLTVKHKLQLLLIRFSSL